MDPWRLTTKAQRQINALAGMALASCVLAGSQASVRPPARTAAASIENAGAKSIVERHEPTLIAAQSNEHSADHRPGKRLHR